MSTEGEVIKNKLLFVKHKFSEALWYGWNVDTAKKKNKEQSIKDVIIQEKRKKA